MSKNTKTVDIYQKVTDKIIAILEKHQNLKFTSTWTPLNGEGLARNPISNTLYRGLNQIILSSATMEKEYSQNRWVTFKQATQNGGKIKKGETCESVTFWSYLYKDKKTGKDLTKLVNNILQNGGKIPEGVKRIPLLRYYNVFNIEQIENLPDNFYFRGETLSFTEWEKDETAEEFIKNTGANIKYIDGDRNCYYYRLDLIQLCKRSQFKGSEEFYRTAFHELGHWTGHYSRFNRDMYCEKESPDYALEELIAELFGAFISANCGFCSQITNNAAYIKSWLSLLYNNKKFIFKAASEAQKAADFAGELVGIKIGEKLAVA